jgi:hypothetical protein
MGSRSTFRDPYMLRYLLPAFAALMLFGPTAVEAQDEPIVIYLVRHAERVDDEVGFDAGSTDDPAISTVGQERAQLLETMLADAGLTQIHSTDLKRTRMTGQPTAEAAGLGIELYNPRDLPGFADRLRHMPGRHLVLGHSNTTPELVAALGGEPGSPIEEMEYDRLYVVTLFGGTASTVLIRFGRLYEG